MSESKQVGRPLLYASPEEMEAKIQEYFETGVKTRTVFVGKEGNKVAMEVKVPTITGLCLFLGFESRQSFFDYEKRDAFSYTIKKARTRIENEYEELLQWGNVTGAIFALKNLGWEDRTQVDSNVNVTTPQSLEDWYNPDRGEE